MNTHQNSNKQRKLQMRNKINELKECNTLREIIETVHKYYDIDTPLKGVSKNIVISQIPNIVEMLRLKKQS